MSAPLVEETSRIVKEAMETAPPGFMVPLKVEVKSGRTGRTANDGRVNSL